jgi:hypothetical protein
MAGKKTNGSNSSSPKEQFQAEIVPVKDLKPHPRNYKSHPDDQLAHIIESIKVHGIYRNIVVAQDNTILAGHGVVQAAAKMGMETVPVKRLPIAADDPRALKLLAGDNEISHLAMIDDRLLTEMLKDIKDLDFGGLLGTGFDEAMLANLVMVTRPEGEIQNLNAAAHWVGMPEYHEGEEPVKLIVIFPSVEKRQEFIDQIKLRIDKKQGMAYSTRWPWTEREEAAALRWQTETQPQA